MFFWNSRKIRWYADALAYTGFDRALADELEPFLPPGESVCDMGCGIGYLALELARRGRDVTAVDRDELALRWLEEQRTAPDNPRILQADWDKLEPRPDWDNVVMVCAGGGQGPEYYRRFARKRLLLLDRVRMESHAAPGLPPSRKKSHLTDAAAGTEGLRRRIVLEFGQPFRSLEDAEDYFRCYYGDSAATQAAVRLTETGRGDFPLYLPYRKELDLLVLEAES